MSNTPRLNVETLEDRRLLSASSLVSLTAGYAGNAYGLDQTAEVYQYAARDGQWHDLNQKAKAVSVGLDAAGHEEVYLRGTDNAVGRIADGVFSATGGKLLSLQAGHGGAFGLDGKNTLWQYDDAAGWATTGKAGTAFSVGTDADGKDEVFLKGLDGVLQRYHAGAWTSTGGKLASFQAGHAEAFGLDGKGMMWRYDDAAGWASAGKAGKALSVGADAEANDEVFLQGTDNSISRYDQGVWTATGGKLLSVQAGRGEAFGKDGKGALWAYRDDAGWQNLGQTPRLMSVGSDVLGRDRLFVQKADKTVLVATPTGEWLNTNLDTGYHVAGGRADGSMFDVTSRNLSGYAAPLFAAPSGYGYSSTDQVALAYQGSKMTVWDYTYDYRGRLWLVVTWGSSPYGTIGLMPQHAQDGTYYGWIAAAACWMA